MINADMETSLTDRRRRPALNRPRRRAATLMSRHHHGFSAVGTGHGLAAVGGADLQPLPAPAVEPDRLVHIFLLDARRTGAVPDRFRGATNRGNQFRRIERLREV